MESFHCISEQLKNINTMINDCGNPLDFDKIRRLIYPDLKKKRPKKETVDDLTKPSICQDLSSRHEYGECMICLEETKFKDFRFPCCGAMMHYPCLKQFYYSEYGDRCPNCRIDIRISYEERHERLYENAVTGKRWAMFDIAENFLNGKGIKKSQKEARYWFQKASKAGCKKSMAAFSHMCRFGRGGPMNQSMASYWLDKAIRS